MGRRGPDALDEGLPRGYTKNLYYTKCNALFEHVYENYYGEGGSVFEEAA
jgi:type I restriction enzyme R subunit